MQATINSNGITCEILQPPGAGSFPAIVIVHGTAGMADSFAGSINPFKKAIQQYGEDLARQGNLVLIPSYFGSVSAEKALQRFSQSRDNWIGTIGEALSFATTLKNVQSDRLGLLGFSMGGHLALWRAKSPAAPKVRALVEFFAPINYPPIFTGIGENLKSLPSLLIHHGTDDTTVPLEQTMLLRKLLIGAGKVEGTDFKIITYEGEEHGFRTSAAITSSQAATAEFFRKHL